MSSSSKFVTTHLIAIGLIAGGILLALVVGLILLVTAGWQLALLVAAVIFGLGVGSGTFLALRNMRNGASQLLDGF